MHSFDTKMLKSTGQENENVKSTVVGLDVQVKDASN